MRKRICKYLVMLLALLPLASCSQNKIDKTHEGMKKGKALVVYPIWWGDMPMPLYSLIEKHNWQGKTVVPFCTHEGSGLGSTESKLKEACEGATVLKGLAVRGTTAQNSQEQARKAVKNWLTSLSE